MNIIGKKLLEEKSKKYSDVRDQLQSWIHEIEDTEWNTLNEIKNTYNTVSILKKNIVVFNIKGNNYRLITKINIKNKIVNILNFGTHDDYSNWKL